MRYLGLLLFKLVACWIVLGLGASCGKHQVITPAMVAREGEQTQNVTVVDLHLRAASAVKQGDGRALAQLVDGNPQLNLNAPIAGEGGKTLVMLAVAWDRPHLVEYLLLQQVDLSLADESGKTVWDYAQHLPLISQLLEGKILSPDQLTQYLIEGIRRDQQANITFTLSRGALINHKTSDGTPLLFLPLQTLTLENAAQKLQTLGQLLAVPAVDPNITDGKQMTLGMWAILKSSPQAFRLWHQHPRTEVNIANGRGETAIFLAVAQGQWQIILDLIADPQTDLQVRNFRNENLQMVVARSKHLTDAQKLELKDLFIKFQ